MKLIGSDATSNLMPSVIVSNVMSLTLYPVDRKFPFPRVDNIFPARARFINTDYKRAYLFTDFLTENLIR